MTLSLQKRSLENRNGMCYPHNTTRIINHVNWPISTLLWPILYIGYFLDACSVIPPAMLCSVFTSILELTTLVKAEYIEGNIWATIIHCSANSQQTLDKDNLREPIIFILSYLLLSDANSIINRLALLINRNSKCNTYCQHKGKKDCVPPTSRMPIQSYNMITARWNAANSKFTLQNVAEISNIKGDEFCTKLDETIILWFCTMDTSLTI